MKELSIEEKAKRYDEAIEKFDVILNLNTVKESGTIFADDVRKILPELKGSENIRIIKAIKYGLDHVFTNNTTVFEVTKEQCLAWLEKQGGITKLSDEEQNKFAKGVLTSCALSFIDYLDAHKYEDKMCVSNGECEDIENAFHNAMWDRLHRYYCKYIEKQGEQKLYVNDNAKEMFIKALERVEEQNNKGYKLTDCDKNSWWEDFKAYTSCTIAQNNAWSEEDEIYIENIRFAVEKQYPIAAKEIVNWLKSLRPQNTWKPSEEQMDALRYVTNFDYGGYKATLVSLYEQLKKLREE